MWRTLLGGAWLSVFRWPMDVRLAIVLFIVGQVYIAPLFSVLDWESMRALSATYQLVNAGDLTWTVGTDLKFFGQTYAYLYGGLLNAFGWLPLTVQRISLWLTLMGVWLWYRIVKQLHNEQVALYAAMALLLSTPVFQATQSFGVQPLTFMLIWYSFYLMLEEASVHSGLLAMVAFETHYMGILAILYTCAYMGTHRKEFSYQRVLWYAVGCLLGLAYYLWMHLPFLQDWKVIVEAAQTAGWETLQEQSERVVAALQRGYRVVEWSVVGFGTLLGYLFPQRTKEPWAWTVVLITSIFALWLPSQSFNPLLYVLPSALLLLLLPALHAWRQTWIMALLMCVFLGRTNEYVQERGVVQERIYMQTLRALITEPIPIAGGLQSWLPFADRDFLFVVELLPLMEQDGLPERFYLFEDEALQRLEQYQGFMQKLKDTYYTESLRRVLLGGIEFQVRLLAKQAPALAEEETL